MSLRRPVHFMALTLAVVVAWLVTGHAPTTAQAPSPGDLEKRLRAVEEKVEQMARLIGPLEGRPGESAAARILADAAGRLRGELAAGEKRLADLRQQNPQAALRGEETAKTYKDRLAQTETKRHEAMLRKAELEEQIAKMERSLRATAEANEFKKLTAQIATAKKQSEEYETVIQTLELQFIKDQGAARELASFAAKDKSLAEEVARTHKALDAVEAARATSIGRRSDKTSRNAAPRFTYRYRPYVGAATMSLRRPVHFIAFMFAVVVAWLVTGHAPTTAQAPSAGTDTEKRLQTLEQKLDRLLTKLDPPPAVDPKVLTKQVDLIQTAREVLATKLEQDMQKYAEFRKANPFLFFRTSTGNTNMFVDRMAKIEAERASMLHRKREAASQVATVENVLARGKSEDAVAALLLLRRRGVDFARLPGVPENDPTALLRLYLVSLRMELEELDRSTVEYEAEFAKAQNGAREVVNYEMEDEQHRTRIAATRQLFENIAKRLQELNLLRAGQP
ncbi:MAG: hypothetical protein U0746_22930 [Gemmataceae bacterium]